jgi:hypothetical protein
MPNFAIMRSKKLSSLGTVASSLKHAYRERETPNADPARTPENDLSGARSTAEAMGKLRERLPEKRRKDAVVAVEYLMTASPDWWKTATKAQQDQFFERAKGWLREKYGPDNIVAEVIHRDETSPHLSAFVVPLTADGRLSAKEYIGNKAQMTKDQTLFATKMRDLGLERGLEGSKARHKTIQRYYAELQAPLEPVQVQPEEVVPRVLEQRMLSKTVETPQQVAERLNTALQAASAPLLARVRAAEEAQTKAKAAVEVATGIQSRLGAFYKAFFEGLRPEQQQSVADQVSMLRQENHDKAVKDKLEAEKQRRVDALPGLLRTKAGAIVTFAQHAIAAIKERAGNWRQVDWKAVGDRAIKESVHEHRQPHSEAVEAVLRYSPAHAGVPEKAIQATLAEVRKRAWEPEKRPEKARDAGLER